MSLSSALFPSFKQLGKNTHTCVRGATQTEGRKRGKEGQVTRVKMQGIIAALSRVRGGEGEMNVD